MSQKIVVADDSATMRQVIQMAFKGSPFSVVAVAGGSEALQAAYDHRPSVVLLDYNLPDRSGMDVCRAIKGDPNLRGIPVLMLGGGFHPFSEDEARGAGADDVIIKPFKTDPIVEKVTALAKSAAAQPAAAAPAPAPTPVSPSGGRIGPLGGGRPAPPGPRNMAATSPGPNPPAGGGRIGPLGGGMGGGGRSRFGKPEAAPAPPPRQPQAPAAQSGSGSMFRQQRSPAPPQRTGGSGSMTPIPGTAPQASPPPAAATPPGGNHAAMAAVASAIDPAEIQKIVRAEVQKAVKEQMLTMVKTVLADLFKERMMPRLLKYGEDRIENIVQNDLQRIMQRRVEEELAKLTGE